MDGLMPFLHATAMPPKHQIDGPIKTSSSPCHTPPKWWDLFHSFTQPPCHLYAKMDGPSRTLLPPYRPIRRKWIGVCYSCTRRPCHPYAKLDRPTENHYLHVTPYAKMDGPNTHPKMDGLIPFWHATAMPPIRQNWLPNQNIATSIQSIRQNGWPYAILARDHRETPYAKINGPIITSVPPSHPYAKNGWAYDSLARDHHATHTSKWTDQPYHHYLHTTHTPKLIQR
jgi:hypothetical protein